MNVNQDFLPDKFKNFNLAKSDKSNEKELISNDVRMEYEIEPSNPVVNVQTNNSIKKEIESSADFLEQQRQFRKPETPILVESKKRTTDQMNSDDFISSMVKICNF